MRVPLSLDGLAQIMDSAPRAPAAAVGFVPYTLAVIVALGGNAPELVYREAVCNPTNGEKLQSLCRVRVLNALREHTCSIGLSHVHWGKIKIETDDHHFAMQLDARSMAIDAVATALLMPDIAWAHAFPHVTGPMCALFRGEEFAFACCAHSTSKYAEELESIWGLGLLDPPRQDALLLCRRGLWKVRPIEDARARGGHIDSEHGASGRTHPCSDADVR